MVVGQDHHVLSLVAITLHQKVRDVDGIIDAALELVLGPKVVDTDQQSLSFSGAVGILESVFIGSAMAETLNTLRHSTARVRLTVRLLIVLLRRRLLILLLIVLLLGRVMLLRLLMVLLLWRTLVSAVALLWRRPPLSWGRRTPLSWRWSSISSRGRTVAALMVVMPTWTMTLPWKHAVVGVGPAAFASESAYQYRANDDQRDS